MIMIVFVMAGFSLTNGIAAAKDTAKESAKSKTIGARESKHPAAQTVYECRKTDEIITIDGKLDEDAWRRAPAMPFVGITDESKPPFITEAKMLWDDKYLYAGYYFEEPDIRAYWAMDEVNCPKELIEMVARSFSPRSPKVWKIVRGTIRNAPS